MMRGVSLSTGHGLNRQHRLTQTYQDIGYVVFSGNYGWRTAHHFCHIWRKLEITLWNQAIHKGRMLFRQMDKRDLEWPITMWLFLNPR